MLIRFWLIDSLGKPPGMCEICASPMPLWSRRYRATVLWLVRIGDYGVEGFMGRSDATRGFSMCMIN